jgi:tRNA U34 2-thiouridine synthase MnmA/TrmU
MKALSLFSGGLDSSLALKLIINQGVEVIALHFVTPLSYFDKEKEAFFHQKVSELGATLKIIYLGGDFAKIVRNPRASFVITGEVVAQRPKSQHKETLRLIEKNSGLEDLLLRPLSAKILEPTLPERENWVNREALLGFNGRSRNPQFKLAEKLGIKNYAWPAGGCLLTNPSFCTRVSDLLWHNECTPDNLELLKIGRHFRLNKNFKLIVGRNEKENNDILKFAADKDTVFEPLTLAGPTALGKGVLDQELKTAASRIIAKYTAKNNEPVEVAVRLFPLEEKEIISVFPIDENKLKQLRI